MHRAPHPLAPIHGTATLTRCCQLTHEIVPFNAAFRRNSRGLISLNDQIAMTLNEIGGQQAHPVRIVRFVDLIGAVT
jgi:hypothetical protein